MTKKIAAVFAFAAFAAGATLAFAGSAAKTGVNGSFHDITYLGAGFGYSQDEFQRVCVFCHTPHNAQTNTGVNPLWNHAQTTQNLPPYTWTAPANYYLAGSFNADPLIGPSRLCQGCHDGVTAVDSHGSAGQANNGNTALTSAVPDPINGNLQKRYIDDLTVTHPIGFLYDDAFNGRGPTEIVPSTSGFIAENEMPFGSTAAVASWDTNNRTVATTAKTIGDTLYGGYMTCASCHEVHNTKNVAPNPASGATYNYFLYAQEEGSAICLSCHVK